jgi:hypothetical protein
MHSFAEGTTLADTFFINFHHVIIIIISYGVSINICVENFKSFASIIEHSSWALFINVLGGERGTTV